VDLKHIGYAAASLALIGLITYGKFKLAVAKPVLWVIFLGGLVFALTTTAQAE
jgi:hypothetical protein